jgi:hypothetical protein
VLRLRQPPTCSEVKRIARCLAAAKKKTKLTKPILLFYHLLNVSSMNYQKKLKIIFICLVLAELVCYLVVLAVLAYTVFCLMPIWLVLLFVGCFFLGFVLSELSDVVRKEVKNITRFDTVQIAKIEKPNNRRV